MDDIFKERVGGLRDGIFYRAVLTLIKDMSGRWKKKQVLTVLQQKEWAVMRVSQLPSSPSVCLNPVES